jgi:hypothetical protein
MGGVVWNLVIFHLSSVVVNSEKRSAKSVLPLPDALLAGVKISSEMAGMLLRLIVSARDMRVMAKVALSRGSSQQGNARRAEIGYAKIARNG